MYKWYTIYIIIIYIEQNIGPLHAAGPEQLLLHLKARIYRAQGHRVGPQSMSCGVRNSPQRMIETG